jgi:phosphate starvation-inducible PhoH-like protein
LKNDVKNCKKAIEILISTLKNNEEIDNHKILMIIESIINGKDPTDTLTELNETIIINNKGKAIRCKTVGQLNYVNAIKNNDITIGIGPAGTGKTYLAVALAVSYYKNKLCEKIILTRPAVEAGEKLGFLPGDLQDKVDPYLRPLYDSLQELFGYENYLKLLEKNVIEIAPLAYMRGRTLSNSFIILDEAQNTSKEQMKMFLTRMGLNSKIVVNGDLTQVDLPYDKVSGLRHACTILKNIDKIAIINLDKRDVVRHKLVQDIIDAYENQDKSFNKVL